MEWYYAKDKLSDEQTTVWVEDFNGTVWDLTFSPYREFQHTESTWGMRPGQTPRTYMVTHDAKFYEDTECSSKSCEYLVFSPKQVKRWAYRIVVPVEIPVPPPE